ncbi:MULTISPECIES: alpha-L-fucosidase [Xanthomonas translucens group]|uniref:alpha-L-fucosidase n=1 Tax=Xanthomonas translucens group TaxID=3390202 RepID=UPI00068D3A90|nr:alpha-L-fucosidase [Xanthomonas translucens]
MDPARWALASRAACAKSLILFAKCHGAFALYPSAERAHSVNTSPWLGGKGDLVKMTSEAVRKKGYGLGFSLSPWDRHEPRYADAKAYDTYYAAQLVELAIA